jgi:hypothetical protein
LSSEASIRSSKQNLGAVRKPDFSADELAEIDRYATDSGLNPLGGFERELTRVPPRFQGHTFGD